MSGKKIIAGLKDALAHAEAMTTDTAPEWVIEQKVPMAEVAAEAMMRSDGLRRAKCPRSVFTDYVRRSNAVLSVVQEAYVIVPADLFNEMVEWTSGAIDDDGHPTMRRIRALLGGGKQGGSK